MSDIGDDWRDPEHIPLDDLSDSPVPVLSAGADPLAAAAAGAAPGTAGGPPDAAAAPPGDGERDDRADLGLDSGTGWV